MTLAHAGVLDRQVERERQGGDEVRAEVIRVRSVNLSETGRHHQPERPPRQRGDVERGHHHPAPGAPRRDVPEAQVPHHEDGGQNLPGAHALAPAKLERLRGQHNAEPPEGRRPRENPNGHDERDPARRPTRERPHGHGTQKPDEPEHPRRDDERFETSGRPRP